MAPVFIMVHNRHLGKLIEVNANNIETIEENSLSGDATLTLVSGARIVTEYTSQQIKALIRTAKRDAALAEG